MKYRATLLVTTDMERTKRFYGEVLGLCIVADFGANITMTGGISFQTLESWAGFIGMPEGKIRLEGRAAELYFEEDDFDGFTARLEKMENIRLVHPVVEHRWGQRAIRFYDPDGHIIEVGENRAAVCRRFLAGGMTVEQTAARMDVPLEMVQKAQQEQPNT